MAKEQKESTERRERLLPEQQMAMKDMSFEEKVVYLATLREKQAISPQLYNHLVNNLINKEMRKDLPIGKKTDSTKSHTTVDKQMRDMVDFLRANINEYITLRNEELAKLSMDNLALYKRLLNNFWVKPLIDELLIIGLRYPDKRVTKAAKDYINEYRISIANVDKEFWLMLWSDPHFVPSDAVRMMMDTEEKRVYPCFNNVIAELEPFIKFQRDKEETRLKLTKYETPCSVKIKRIRRESRLQLFNDLLEAIEKISNVVNG